MQEVLQLIDGRLQPIEKLCFMHGVKTGNSRKEDTNRQIVEMLVNGRFFGHYYYRSDQWIDQPYRIRFGILSIEPYVGPPENAPAESFGNGTYKVDDFWTSQLD